VPRTQTFCAIRSRLNDGREIGIKGQRIKRTFFGVRL
jgi:hypothetical protein